MAMASNIDSAAVPDVDPAPYPGQPETQEHAPGMPTVLNKLQKWGDYASFGEPVHPSRFVPMKTPLSGDIISSWTLEDPPRHTLTVSGMVQHQAAHGRRVGLIIDLSNHECLYCQDLLNASLAYEHIKLVAKELPPLDYVNQVAAVAKAFWAEHPDEYIAIHCAYGFNRTGFIVTSFLIQEYGLTVDQALQAFATARPPGVKHEKFKLELARRYPGPTSALQAADAAEEAASDNSSLSPTVAKSVDAQLDDPDAFCSGRPTACSNEHSICGEAAAGEPCPDAATCSSRCSVVPQAGPALGRARGRAPGAAQHCPSMVAVPGTAVEQCAADASDGAAACAPTTPRSSTCSSSSTGVPIPNAAGRPLGTCAAATTACRMGAGPAGSSMGEAASPPADNESLGFTERVALASLRHAGGSQEQGSSSREEARSSLQSGQHRSLKDLQWVTPAAAAAEPLSALTLAGP